MSTHDVEERAFSEQPSDRKIKADKKKRLQDDKSRSGTRVNIGTAFQRWRELKEWKACNQTLRLLWFFSIGK